VNTTGVVVVRCDALSDNQKWVFDVENDLIRYKADTRFCLGKVRLPGRLDRMAQFGLCVCRRVLRMLRVAT
jgi:hypothetical protein